MRPETIEQIFQSAVEVFAHSGFERAKMDEIARRAGVAKGTIYYHFKGKEELFVALMNDGMERIMDQLRRRMEVTEDPVHQLEGLLEGLVEYLYHNGTFAKLLISESWGSIERQHEFRARLRELVELIEDVLGRGGARGCFLPVKGHDTAVAIFGAASVAVLQDLFRDPDEKPAPEERIGEMADHLKQLIYKGVVASRSGK
ncbi:TetR family transcriptional regulator [Kroppenstedtia guangzhouensis]|uniref:TetR family transcriptional regulator n=1 Tax=Kroppenstedtia guangzhouensis TaxID=1274356 RepID=A0ABQ1GMK3_9BACL|nr:TetR/AcrR family transcriptional regulator [Kroppenstedtia guangzhouensis]GGA46798.1 TetR family transcriptional regulator [Kroppenstedtia guangzhouensis]